MRRPCGGGTHLVFKKLKEGLGGKGAEIEGWNPVRYGWEERMVLGLDGQGQNFGLFHMGDERPLRDVKQGSDVICFKET